ncbi:MAG: hypothetical protein GC193_09485 [Cryomorphaceae bacterium]|nr:hypothetical protein [Cryomorphaceae bacterium]
MRALVFLFLSSLSFAAFGQSTAITVDGFYNDWAGGLPTVTDGGDVGTGIDLVSFTVTNDQEFLYVRLLLNQEIDLVDNTIPHTLYLYIDTDANASTGFNVAPGFGSELGITFSQRFAYYDVVPATTVSLADIGLRALPTVTSNEFEIAIKRSVIPDGVNPLFPSSSIRMMFRETLSGDRMPNNGTLFTYTFDDTPTPPTPLIGLDKLTSTDLRIVAWNVNGRFTQTNAESAINRILLALEPDIIGFSEASNVSTAYVKSRLDSWLPLGDGVGWRVVKDDYDMVTASKYDILQAWPGLNRQYPVLIDVPGSVDLLFNSAHYSCCAAESSRQNQADEYINFILDAQTPGGSVDLPTNTPFILGGDLNLVGYSQQLHTLLHGDIQNTATYGQGGLPDWDATPCSLVVPRQTDKRMAYTWRDDNDSYPPGWLDYLIFSDAAITLEQGYTLQTAVMSPARLAIFGLLSNDDLVASDHFPVIGDFSFPIQADTDGDGVPDTVDNCMDVQNPDQADFNADGLGDVCQDTDNDGLLDAFEILQSGTNLSIQDSDGDGLTDYAEINTTNTDPLLFDSNGNGVDDLTELLNPTICGGDLNFDNVSDVSDLLLLLQFFGSSCD